MSNQNQVKSNIEESNCLNDTKMIDILLSLSKHKTKIVFFPIFFGIAGLIFSLILPNIYRANTKILPPQQSQSSTSAMLSQLSGLAGGAGAALGIKNPNDLFIALLKSRSISDNLIKKFDLQKRYNQKYLENTRIQLEKNTSIVSGKDNIISIDVEDEDPNIAAEIANAYIEELSLLTGKFALTEASQRRSFYEKQLDLTKNRMIEAENTLATNIPNSGLSSIDTQSKALLETTAKLRASISAKEIQLKALQTFVTSNNPQFKSVNQELIGMKSELSKLESGSIDENSLTLKTNLDKTNKNTSSISNFQILRDVKYYQTLYEMLAKQFELARLDEAKDAPLIQVLDRATQPEMKSKPKRALITITFFFIGLISSIFLSIITDSISKNWSESDSNKFRKIKENLKIL